MILKTTLSRRNALEIGLAGMLAALAPHMAVADEAGVAEAMKKILGDKKAEEGKIKLDLPQIAENGLVVPLNIDVESPMSDADYVKTLYVFGDGNPLPQVATYKFYPASGKASISSRMRLAKTQNIIAIAEMSNGKIYTAKTEVKVTIGGCGG